MSFPDETTEERPIDPTEGESGDKSSDSEEPRDATGPLRILAARLGASRGRVLGGLAAVLILILGGTAAWLAIPPAVSERPGKGSDPVSAPGAIAETPDRLVKQDLAPFYIPLPHGKNGQMARVSFAVTWDRPSSSRFQDQETRVRDRLFRRMTELAAEGENMRSMSLTVRAEASKILRELLRPEELRVVVTGIFIV